MLRNNRVIFNNNGTLSDLSVNLSNYHSLTSVTDIVAAQDYLYLGSDLPFNHRYFDVSVVNTNASVISTLEYWSGNGWKLAVDVLDETLLAGASLGKSGIISWQVPPNETSWNWDDTDDMNASGLQTLKIYGLYWVRIKWSADMIVTTALNYVGHRFSEDDELLDEYPELGNSNFMTAFETGKTNWKEQTLAAAEYIIQDLRALDVVNQANQILDWKIFSKASVHKTAQIIYRGFGDDYKDNRDDAAKAYKESLTLRKYNVDLNRDAVLQENEKNLMTGYLKR